MGLAALFYGAMLALAGIIAWFSGRSLWFRSPEAASAGVDWGVDPWLGFAVAAVIILASIVLERTAAWARDVGRALAEELGRLGVGQSVVLALFSGVAEEVLFRGALQPLVGWVAASLLFGLAHLPPRRDLWPWTVTSLVAGFVLGGLYELSGNLVAPVCAHFGINAVNLRRLTRRYAAD